MPEKSGLPSGILGVGPSRFGLPSGVLGTLADENAGHCARARGETAATATIKKTVFSNIFISGPLLSDQSIALF
jgi:hypothetical protein